MSIRVHKDLGYGLADVKTGGLDIADPRVASTYRDEASRDEFLSFLAARAPTPDIPSFHASCVKSFVATSASWEPRHSVVHEGECGLPGVLLFVPPGFTQSWRRSDEMIDWVEETMPAGNSRPQTNHVRELPRPLYPFESWMDARTGVVLADTARNYMQCRALAREADPASRSFDFDKMAANAGFASAEEADRAIVPWVPPAVRLFVEFLEIFPDKTTSISLRPLLYTWWG